MHPSVANRGMPASASEREPRLLLSSARPQTLPKKRIISPLSHGYSQPSVPRGIFVKMTVTVGGETQALTANGYRNFNKYPSGHRWLRTSVTQGGYGFPLKNLGGRVEERKSLGSRSEAEAGIPLSATDGCIVRAANDPCLFYSTHTAVAQHQIRRLGA